MSSSRSAPILTEFSLRDRQQELCFFVKDLAAFAAKNPSDKEVNDTLEDIVAHAMSIVTDSVMIKHVRKAINDGPSQEPQCGLTDIIVDHEIRTVFQRTQFSFVQSGSSLSSASISYSTYTHDAGKENVPCEDMHIVWMTVAVSM